MRSSRQQLLYYNTFNFPCPSGKISAIMKIGVSFHQPGKETSNSRLTEAELWLLQKNKQKPL